MVTAATWNITASYKDFLNVKKITNPSISIEEGSVDEVLLQNKYKDVEQKACDVFKTSASVFFLQEVVNDERVLIKRLKDMKFEIFHLQTESFDSAIALDPKKFPTTEERSFVVKYPKDEDVTTIHGRQSHQDEVDVACVFAEDTEKKKYCFLSAHIPGFEFGFSGKKLGEAAELGDKICESILVKLNEIAKDRIQIFGGDLNASPEIWNPRFKKFTDTGFKLIRLGLPTNFNPNSEDAKWRELDYFFVKESPKSTIEKIAFFFQPQLYAHILENTDWAIDETRNHSDHLPVFCRLEHNVPVKKFIEDRYRVILAFEITAIFLLSASRYFIRWN